MQSLESFDGGLDMGEFVSSGNRGPIREFQKIRGVLIRGILPFRVLYSGPLFSEPPISTSAISSQLVSSRAEASQPQEAQILQRERQLRPRCRRGCECADGTAGARRRRLGVKAEVCLKLCS